MLLAYKIIVTIFNAMFMSAILLMKKEDRAVSIISFMMIVLIAMNIGLIWN